MIIAATNTQGAVIWWADLGPDTTTDDWPTPGVGETIYEAPAGVNETYYWNGTAIVARPTIPAPTPAPGEANWLQFSAPPAGLWAKVYDTYTEPPHLISDTALTAPDCGLYLVEGGVTYLIELTADFPYLPLTFTVEL